MWQHLVWSCKNQMFLKQSILRLRKNLSTTCVCSMCLYIEAVYACGSFKGLSLPY